MRISIVAFAALLVAAPSAWANEAPAAASSSTTSNAQPSLEDIRHFARVYQVIRQAYVEPVNGSTLLDHAIAGMVSGLDPHSSYLDKEGLVQLDEDTSGQYSGLGIQVEKQEGALRIISPIDDTPAARAGIRAGDMILKIDGKEVTADNTDAMFKQLRGDPGSKITLTLLHEKSEQPVDLQLTRERINTTSVKLQTLEPGYLYIRISEFQDGTGADLGKKYAAYQKKNATPQGVVLDLRSNPGGLLIAAVAVSNAFLDSGTIATTRGRLDDANLKFEAHHGDLTHGAPMVVLVDHGTASAAEIVSGALKDNHRALIMGRRTFGKGVVQTVLPLDQNHAIKLTTARYYTPSGTSIQAEGIQPDIPLADLTVNPPDHHASATITSEADLPGHLVNEKGGKGKLDNDGSAANEKIATRDYALSQALNVLKGLAMRGPPNKQ